MASVSFFLASTSLACLLFLEGNNAFSLEEESKDFELHRTVNFDGMDVMENVSAIDDTPHTEGAAEMMDRVHLNFNNSMLEKKVAGKCHLFSGKWVHDASYPLYPAGQCPYLVEGRVNCRKNGRPDSDYEKWRWQPRGCSIPRFNAKNLLWRLRGKRLMFVGDSITRSQWESMVCLLEAVIPANKKTLISRSSLKIFKALVSCLSHIKLDISRARFLSVKSYNFFSYLTRITRLLWSFCGLHFWFRRALTVIRRELYIWTLLGGMGFTGKVLMSWFSSHHTGGFMPKENLWFNRWDLVMEGNRLYRNMDPLVSYKKGLTTWANWISANLDPRRSLVFYRTTSPKHESPSDWNEPNGHRCYNQWNPVHILRYRPPVPSQVPIVKQVLRRTRFPVTLLDITRLSEFRKDGHPSIYSSDLNREQRKYPDRFADCSHWCLPGVPDTWNELLYASLLLKGFGR